MADLSTIKIQKIKVAGLAIYPATILDAVKDATAKITVNGEEKDNPSYGKTLREIIVDNEKVTASALTELDSRAGKLANLSTTEKGSLVAAINEVASSASGATGDLTTLTTDAKTSAVAAINELDAAIDTLNGDADTEGSVDAKIAAVKKEILTGDSTETINEAYDTLLEVGKWITDDESGAAALSAQVGKNTTAIGEKAVAGSDAVLYTYEEYVALEGKEGTTQEEFEALNVQDKTKTPAQLGSEATGLYKDIADIKADMVSDAVTVSATDGVTKNGVTYKYVHDASKTAADAAFVKVGGDAEGHVVIGDAVTTTDVTALLVDGEGKDLYDANGAAAAVQGDTTSTVKDVVDAIGVASQAESAEGAGDAVEATGLHKKIEDVAADLAGKNVDAEGDDFVSAEATDNKVTVATTTATIASQATEGADNGLTTASDVYAYALTAVATSDTTEYADVF